MQLAQDPNEFFDVVTETGEPTGIVKRRADVHRDGDWHRAVHVWLHGADESGSFVLFQQRGRNKDTWPYALDATVGGHLGAGETVADALREVREEIGVCIDPDRYEHLFRRTRSSENLIPGVLDRELQEVFLLRDDRPLTAFAPNPVELEGLVRVSLPDALRLVRGESATCMGTLLVAESGETRPNQLTAEQLLVRGTDTYFVDVVSAIRERAAASAV